MFLDKLHRFFDQASIFISAPRYVRQTYWYILRQGYKPVLYRKLPEDIEFGAPWFRWAPIEMSVCSKTDNCGKFK